MNNNSQLEDLIVEDLNAEEQVSISGGNSPEFSSEQMWYIFLYGGPDAAKSYLNFFHQGQGGFPGFPGGSGDDD